MSSSNWRSALTAAKTHPPRLLKILKRQECLNVLEEATGHKIVFICGRAGQGKTTLAASWLRETKRNSVWLTLDEGDNNPVALFRLFAEAFLVAFPRIAFELPPVPTGAPFDPTIFARTFFRHLLAQVPRRYVIVLDDFHTMDEDGSVPAIFEVLIESLPPKVQLILLSRKVPPQFLAKWIATRQLFSVGEESLKFSATEVALLFDKVFGRAITPSQAETLQASTEGWVTGLILLHEGSRNTTEGINMDPSLWTGSEDRIFDYLYHEIYRRLDPALQATIIRLALFDSFSMDSARRLVSGVDASIQIRFLLSQHLLVKIVSEGQIRFRYHPLLRQFLRTQARALPQEECRILVDQVGAIQESEGMVDQAINLYLEFGHYEQATRLLERIGLPYTLQGKRYILRQWIRSIPSVFLEHHPWLRYFLANDQAFVNPAEAFESYGLAVAGFERTGDIEGEMWARSSRMMLAVYAGNDFRPIKADAKWGEQVLRGEGGSLLARAAFLLADAFTAFVGTDNPQHALRKALKAAQLANQAGARALGARALVRAAFSAGYLGNHRKAISLFDQSESVLPWSQFDPPLRAEALIYRGIVETFYGQKTQSREHLSEAEQICLNFGLKSQTPFAQAHLVWNRIILGERQENDVPLEPIKKKMFAAGNYFYSAVISHSQALLCMEAGNFDQALKYEEESLSLAQQCHTRFLLLLPLATLGAILGELGEYEKAGKYLRRALTGFKRAGSDMYSFMALIHLAKLSLDYNKKNDAKKYLIRALSHGRREYYRVGEGIRPKVMSSLLGRARLWELESGYVEKLMDFWKVQPDAPLKIHLLGRFEATLDERPIPEAAWHGRKSKLFLIALTSTAKDQIPKEEIMDLLWPDAEGPQQVSNFHTTFHRLQSVFGRQRKSDRFFRLSQKLISLNRISCWSDCGAFEEAIRMARRAESAARWNELKRYLQEARALYQGDFVPPFGEEDPWIVGKRQKLRKDFEWVCQHLQTSP